MSRQRRYESAGEVLGTVRVEEATIFNTYLQGVESFAFYGCGVLAATHIGGLRALELHGLRYDRIHTLAGVSAGSVVVAMLAIGYDADGHPLPAR